jgi:hypothetical protein
MCKKFLFGVILFFASISPAFAWNCTTPNAIRVQVPNGTVTAQGTGDGLGQIVVDGGLTFECEILPPPSTTSPTSNTNTNSNANTNANNNANTNNNKASATATGGTATSNSNSTAGVSNSGNSTNLNSVNTSNDQKQKQSQGQQQTQSNTSSNNNASSASGNGVGNGNNSNDSTTNIAAPKIPVASAITPPILPTVTCFKGFGGSAQTAPLGVSFGGGKIDENCAILETARAFNGVSRLAQCKVLLTDKYVKKAGVTLADCLPEPVIIAVTAPVVVAPVVVVPAPVVEVPEPVVVPEPDVPVAPEAQLVGICTFSSGQTCALISSTNPLRVTTVCEKMLAAVAQLLKTHPESSILLVGNRNPQEDSSATLARAQNVKKQLTRIGVAAQRVDVTSGTGTARTVEIYVR